MSADTPGPGGAASASPPLRWFLCGIHQLFSLAAKSEVVIFLVNNFCEYR